MFGVMTAVFTRRLRLFILLFLAEGLETSASFALSFRIFFPLLFLDSVWYLEEALPCFPGTQPPTHPKGGGEGWSPQLGPQGRGLSRRGNHPLPGDQLAPYCIHLPIIGLSGGFSGCPSPLPPPSHPTLDLEERISRSGHLPNPQIFLPGDTALTSTGQSSSPRGVPV